MLQLTRQRVLIRDVNIDDPRGDKKAMKELCSYECTSPGPKAVEKSLKTTVYGPVSQGKVGWQKDEPFMRCDLKEYKLAGSKSKCSLIIVRKKDRWDWPPQAEEGRQPPFRMYIWVYFADNVSWFIRQ